ncbi:MFS transporter [Niallia circulans]|uniref:MFS transporter n=1 Tax=Niallia circulans TaxID=1397 RepID=A0A941GNM2_NIACI|nr:MFS transporter [Niallia circulans]MCB5237667.1 MFS transporter [Niallia circulans]
MSIKEIKIKYYIVNIFYMMSLAIFSAIFYVYLSSKGFSYLEINYFSIAFWLSSFLTEIPAGVFSDRYGRKRSLQVSILIRSVGLVFLYWTPNIWVLIASGILTAIGESFKSGTLESWALERIKLIDSKYNSNNFFSLDKFLVTGTSMFIGLIGAQVIGQYNLSLPFIIAPIMLLLTGVIVHILIDNDTPSEYLENNTVTNKFHSFFNDLSEGLKYIKSHKYLFRLIISFLPLQFVLSGPASQWQLYFQGDDQSIITGYLSVIISLAGMFGHYLSMKIGSKFDNRNRYLILTSSFNGLMIIMTVLIDMYWLSFFFFCLHVVSMASEEAYRFSYLNDEIKNKNRATVLSIYYSIESAFTVLTFYFVGIIADKFSLKSAWIVSSIIMLVLAIPMFISLEKGRKI